MRATSQVISQTRGNVICEHAEIADTPLRRLRGLLGRSALPAGDGMLLKPAPSIHSAFMRFEFDAVFLDREMRVVRVAPRIKPWRARSARHAKSVLELAAGEVERRGVQVGDHLALDSATNADEAAMSNPGNSDGADHGS